MNSALVRAVFLLAAVVALLCRVDAATLFVESNPTSNPFSQCRSWQSASDGNNLLANYPTGGDVIPAVAAPDASKPAPSGYGDNYWFPWPSRPGVTAVSGLRLAGRLRQSVSELNWFSVAALTHVNRVVFQEQTFICNRLSMTIPFKIYDSSDPQAAPVFSKDLVVSFIIEETPNYGCGDFYPRTWTVPGYVGNPPGAGYRNRTGLWDGTQAGVAAGLGVCPYGPSCQVKRPSDCTQANCDGLFCQQSECGTGCYDRVTISGTYAASETFTAGGQTYFLSVLGFQSTSTADSTQPPLQQFLTVEDSESVAFLYAKIQRTCTADSGCNDNVPCTADTCVRLSTLSANDPRRLVYPADFCQNAPVDAACSAGQCGRSRCTSSGCTAPTADASLCPQPPASSCKAAFCQDGTFTCLNLTKTNFCPCLNGCQNDGTCFCPTTTTVTTTTTTPAATTQPQNAIVPYVRCMNCAGSQCRVTLGYEVKGDPCLFDPCTDGVLNIAPNGVSNYIMLNGVVQTANSYDVGQPQDFYTQGTTRAYYTAGFIVVPWNGQSSFTVTWYLTGYASTRSQSSGSCTQSGSCLSAATNLFTSLSAWLSTPNANTYRFFYDFQVASTLPRTSCGSVQALVVKVPRCSSPSAVSATATCRRASPGPTYLSANVTEDPLISNAATCLFSNRGGRMGWPVWDALDIPLSGMTASAKCTVIIEIDRTNCPGLTYPTGVSSSNLGRLSAVTTGNCTESCGPCNTFEMFGPIYPCQATGSSWNDCSSSTFYNPSIGCTCQTCPACPTNYRRSSSSDAFCQCSLCTPPTCPLGQRLSGDYCSSCTSCLPTCSCSYTTAGCTQRVHFNTSQCGECYDCPTRTNFSLTTNSSTSCIYTPCNPKCDPKYNYPQSDACLPCIACTPVACPPNQTSKDTPCYCVQCPERPPCPDGKTYADPSNWCNTTQVNCPVCAANTSYPDTKVQCARGAVCLPCPNHTAPNPPCSSGFAPSAANPCSCVACPQCANGTLTRPGYSCACTPCPDLGCSYANQTYCSSANGCRYRRNGSNQVDLCLGCEACPRPTCTAVKNFTFGVNWCAGCVQPCTRQNCTADQVYVDPTNTCSNCVKCQSTAPLSAGFVNCPGNSTLNLTTCTCQACVDTLTCSAPDTVKNASNLCAPSCTFCALSRNCPQNRTWDGVSYCNPCVDCPPSTTQCAAGQLYVPPVAVNACPTCRNCTTAWPPCQSNQLRDAFDLCKCNTCPTPSCGVNQFLNASNVCAGCQNCTTPTCSFNQQLSTAAAGRCQTCTTCTPTCAKGSTFNASDPCKGCYACQPGVNVPACSPGWRPDPSNACLCVQCVPLNASQCPWQTVPPADPCGTACVPCTPGCNYNTTIPDAATNGCTCRNCTGSGGLKLAADGDESPLFAAGKAVSRAAAAAAAAAAELCCPQLYQFSDYCQNPIYNGFNLSKDYRVYQCNCTLCATFMTCEPGTRLVECQCVACPQPNCTVNQTVAANICNGCVNCTEPVCSANFTRAGTNSTCQPCQPCPVPVCPANYTAHLNDTCLGCRLVPPNETVCPFGQRIDPADSTRCLDCPPPACAANWEPVSNNPCDGCKPCVRAPCPANYTRGTSDACANCTLCPVPAYQPNYRINWTDLCDVPSLCLPAVTAAACPGNYTVNASDSCLCAPCPEPHCSINERRVSDDYCDGCQECPVPVCPANTTLDVSYCLPCTDCPVKNCSANTRVNYTDLCAPCIYCHPADTVCPPNETVSSTDSCLCTPCPDPACSCNERRATDDYCDGCVACVPAVCQENFTRTGVTCDCDPCAPCPEPACAVGQQVAVANGTCPYCELCAPGVNVPACPFGWRPNASNLCACEQCARPVCPVNYSQPVDPCQPCQPCPEPSCPKNYTVIDTCKGCTPCLDAPAPGFAYVDPTDVCKGVQPCVPTPCGFGERRAADLCNCEVCLVASCPVGFQRNDDVNGCDCLPCQGIVCPIGTVITEDGCGCEVLTINDLPNVTTTRCNRTERDACGVCYGRNRTCIGCDGQIGTPRYVDACGVICGLGDTCPGCTGESCSICVGVVDLCGVCDGNSSTCDGCDGVAASGAIYDICGVCDGNGTSCLGCFGIPFGPPCSTPPITAAEAAAVSVLVALAALGCLVLALIAWRMRSRPEILFQEWDNLIAEHIQQINDNPIFYSQAADTNPLFANGAT